MSRDLLIPADTVAPRVDSPHFFVQRGHHGRYRFVMISDGERIGGEIRVDATDNRGERSRVLALARIARLAEVPRASVMTLEGR